ncbi:hypothetical protein K388_07190 [Streptomyces sp. KhCrAH-43]|uniref:hypothetical protein n=1 Tax=unclassified Streptomyces TaxID=2593676 RepID=UPI000376C696|nr:MULTISPECIES: hypothetical protein [unclassified Streptomyces]MYS39654.1 hypothetical protein [Streptomyces sp. SID4920]MYX64334.1 hypothetical protein [Streptomyces sp. SID8373]RAJ47779.1 hypothetical protein K388_07190 [Streptomyces sp. KhCrAH-43]
MPEYEITWTIDLDAAGPVDAARKALTTHRNPTSWATVFTVRGAGQMVTVDLDPDHTDPSGQGTSKVTPAA